MPNVKILCRVRPPIHKEKRVVFVKEDKSSVVVPPGEEYTYDAVFGEKCKSADIMSKINEIVSPEHDLAILLYGPTNAGKTTTLMGMLKPFLEGAMLSEFRAIEVYNGKSIILMEKCNMTADNASKIVKNAMAKRSVGATSVNSTSSRSHVLLTFWMSSGSILTFVDLAGCERLEQSGNDPVRRTEAIHVNKALTALRDVVEGIATAKDFIPYRNSKLTLALKEHLRRDESQLVIILCCNHNQIQSTETLRFGRSATRRNKCDVPQIEESNTEGGGTIDYKEAYEKAEQQLNIMRQALASLEISPGSIKPKKAPKCGLCGVEGHNRRTCTSLPLPTLTQEKSGNNDDELQKK